MTAKKTKKLVAKKPVGRKAPSLAKTIKKSNKKFQRMTAAQKRVVIAQDVLNALATKRITACNGVYFEGYANKSLRYLIDEKNYEIDVQKALKEIPNCTVCGIGACFVAAVDRFDKLKTDASVLNTDSRYNGVIGNEVDFDANEIRFYLNRFFSKQQIALIEAAFEGRHPDMDPIEANALYKVSKKAPRRFLTAFYPQQGDAKKRMTRIMENIIENNGEFIWPEKFSYVADDYEGEGDDLHYYMNY